MPRQLDHAYVLAGNSLKQTPAIRFAAGEDVRAYFTPTSSGSIVGKTFRFTISDTVNDAPLYAAADTDITRVNTSTGTMYADLESLDTYEWPTGIYVGELRETTSGANTLLKRYVYNVDANPDANGEPVNFAGATITINGTTAAVSSSPTFTVSGSGGTTVGEAFVNLTNPSAITFPRINADNSVSALSASDFRAAIGAGTSSFDGAYGSLSGVPSTLVKTDQTNVYGNFLQDFRGCATILAGGNTALYDVGDPTKQAVLFTSAITASTVRNFYLPDMTGTFVLTGGAQLLSSKTLRTTNCKFSYDASETKLFAFDASALSVGTRTYTVKDADGTLAFTTDITNSPTITTPDINGGTADSLTSLSVRSTGAAFDLAIASAEVLTGNKTLTVSMGDTNRTLTLGGNTTLNGGTHSGTNTGDQTTITGNAGTATALQTARTIGGTSFDGTANIVPATITVAAVNVADATCFVALFESATGDLGPKTDSRITYDATSGTLAATGFLMVSDGSQKLTLQNVDDSANQVLLVKDSGGTSTATITGAGTITAASFSGPLTGNVTGNCSGSSGSTTGNAATATALATARAINGVNFDGTAAITVTAAAGTLTGTTLNSTVVTSSLTSVGTIATGVWQGTAVADSYIASATTWNAKQAGDATLTALAALTIAADSLTIGTGADAFSQTTFAANTFPAKASTGNLVAKAITDFGLSLVDDADASTARTTLGLGTLATQSGTFSGTSSGTNTGDQSIFASIVVSGQTTVTTASTSQTLTLVAGTNITLTTDNTAKSVTITASGGGISDGDKGDITVSASGATWAIDSGVVTLAKMANLAQDAFIIRTTASTGVPETATCTAAARTVLDDTTVAAMVDTLGGASSTGTGGLVRATSPTITTPTISGAITFPDGVRQTFNPDGTNAGLNVGSQAGDPSAPSNGDLWYDSTANELTARINGANVALGSPTEASQAEMETPTGSTQMVTPRRIQQHPGVAKGWILFNGTGTIAITVSHNVASITDNGTGDYTVTWDTDFSSANYAMAAINQADGSANLTIHENRTLRAAGSARIICQLYNVSSQDNAAIHAVAFGDQ